jgi:hypothetical protein
LNFIGTNDVVVSGEGTIDGSGLAWPGAGARRPAGAGPPPPPPPGPPGGAAPTAPTSTRNAHPLNSEAATVVVVVGRRQRPGE